MEAVVRALLIKHRELVVRVEVIVVPELVVDGDEVFLIDLHTHLDAKVVVVGEVPRAGVTHDLVIGGLLEERSLPERRRQWIHAERREEAFT